MIGQLRIIKGIDQFVKNSSNRFIIIVGEKGCGKKVATNHLAKSLKASLVVNEIKVDSVRDCIKTAYTQIYKIVYAFYDVDKMSLQAKNSFLKITEEPPKKAYVVLTVTNKFNLPATLHSRATIFDMQDYSEEQLLEYQEKTKSYTIEETKQLLEICTLPGDFDYFQTTDINTFYEFVHLVVENIADVSGANAFKITQKIKTKIDGEGFEAYLFLKVVAKLFLKKVLTENNNCDYQAWKITSIAKHDLSINGINKQFLIDKWILDVRDIFLGD